MSKILVLQKGNFPLKWNTKYIKENTLLPNNVFIMNICIYNSFNDAFKRTA